MATTATFAGGQTNSMERNLYQDGYSPHFSNLASRVEDLVTFSRIVRSEAPWGDLPTFTQIAPPTARLGDDIGTIYIRFRDYDPAREAHREAASSNSSTRD